MKLTGSLDYSDEQLYRFIKEGDHRAFTQVYYKYYRLLYALSYRYLMDKDKAEDAIQYVFVRLWEYRSDLNVDISLKNFLFTMTKNYVLNVIRNETSALEKNYEIAQGMSEYEDDLIVKMEKRERMDLVYKAIEKLPEQKKTICLLKLKEEMSNSEIAERMNLSVNTVKTHYSESLKFLRLCLKELLIIVITIVLIGKIGV